MKIHPLRLAYIDYIKQEYGKSLWGDKSPERTSIVAQKVMRLGLDYDDYVEVACSIHHRWAKAKGWPYPYWNVVTSDGTIKRVNKLIDIAGCLADTGNSAEFEMELMFALNYVWWLLGQVDDRPRRSAPASVDTRMRVAEYVCMTHGIFYVTSNLNIIASQIRNKLGR